MDKGMKSLVKRGFAFATSISEEDGTFEMKIRHNKEAVVRELQTAFQAAQRRKTGGVMRLRTLLKK